MNLQSYETALAQPGVRRTMLASLAARLPLGMTSLAMLLLARSEHLSFGVAGLLAASFAGFTAILTPVQGRLMDRRSARRVLVVTVVGHSLLLVAFVVVLRSHAQLALAIVVAAAAGALVPAISGCSRTFWAGQPHAVRESVYVLDAITQELIFTAGPMIVAVVATTASPTLAVLMAATSTLIGGLWFLTTPAAHDRRAPAVGGGPSPLVDGAIAPVLASVLLCGVATGSLELGLPALAAHLGDRRLSGLLLGLLSVGSLVGGLVLGARRSHRPAPVRARILLAAATLSVLPLVAVTTALAAVPLSFVAGLFWASLFGCLYALIGALAPPSATTEAFGLTTGSLVAGIAIGSAAAGALVDRVGVHLTFVVAPAALILAAALTAVPAVGFGRPRPLANEILEPTGGV